jgi:hypothetical protein
MPKPETPERKVLFKAEENSLSVSPSSMLTSVFENVYWLVAREGGRALYG